MGEKKTTVFEINVENFELSPSASGLERVLGGVSDESDESDEESAGSKLGLFGSDDEVEEDVEVGEQATEVDVENEDEETVEDGGGSSIGLIIGLLFLLIVATVVKKFVAESEPEEYEEVELSEYEN